MKNQSNETPNLSAQLKQSLALEAELLHKSSYASTISEYGELMHRRVAAINETERLRLEILRSDAAFMAANNNFAGNSVFVD